MTITTMGIRGAPDHGPFALLQPSRNLPAVFGEVCDGLAGLEVVLVVQVDGGIASADGLDDVDVERDRHCGWRCRGALDATEEGVEVGKLGKLGNLDVVTVIGHENDVEGRHVRRHRRDGGRQRALQASCRVNRSLGVAGSLAVLAVLLHHLEAELALPVLLDKLDFTRGDLAEHAAAERCVIGSGGR